MALFKSEEERARRAAEEAARRAEMEKRLHENRAASETAKLKAAEEASPVLKARQEEMRGDPLLRWFYRLRSDVLKDIAPLIGVVLGSSGVNALKPGTITVDDRPPPDSHRGRPIGQRTMIEVCRHYVTYLEEMFQSAADLAWEVHDRHVASIDRNAPAQGDA